MSEDLSGFSLLELFRMEAESHTATLSAGLVALEGASASPEVIEPLMCAAHSLKGAARIVGLDAAVRVAHAMEDGFVAAQKGQFVLQPEHVDILLRGVDLLVQIAQLAEPELESWQADHAAEIDALVADLTAVKEGRTVTRAGRAPSEPSLSSPSLAKAEPGGGPLLSPVTEPAEDEAARSSPSLSPLRKEGKLAMGAGLPTPPMDRPKISRNRASIPIGRSRPRSRRRILPRRPIALHFPLPTPHPPLRPTPHPPLPVSCGSPPRV